MFSRGHFIYLNNCLLFYNEGSWWVFLPHLKKRLLLDGASFHPFQINPKALMLINAGHCWVECLTQSRSPINICQMNAALPQGGRIYRGSRLNCLIWQGKRSSIFYIMASVEIGFICLILHVWGCGTQHPQEGAGINLCRRTQQAEVAFLDGISGILIVGPLDQSVLLPHCIVGSSEKGFLKKQGNCLDFQHDFFSTKTLWVNC